jgi:hypothetical protein
MKLLFPLLGVLALCANAAHAACVTTQFSAGPAELPAENEDPVVAGKYIYAAYQDPSGLVLQVSADGGSSWNATVLDPVGSFPRIAVAGTDVYVTWASCPKAANCSISFTKLSGRGAAPGPVRTLGLSRLTAQTINGDNELQIDASKREVAVIYGASTGNDMTVADSQDGGASFTQTSFSVPTSAGADEEVIAVSGRQNWVGWEASGSDGLRKNFQAVSTNGFKTYAEQTVTPTGVESREPIVALDHATGILYLVWRDDHLNVPGEVSIGNFASSTNFGATWSAPAVINASTFDGREYNIAADSGNVYIAYNDQIGKFWYPALVMSANGGTTFSAPIYFGDSGISGNFTNEFYEPRVWADGDSMSIVYYANGSIYLGMSNRGAHKTPTIMLVGQGTEPQLFANTVLWRGASGQANFTICKADRQ